jgi:hypothetical protein
MAITATSSMRVNACGACLVELCLVELCLVELCRVLGMMVGGLVVRTRAGALRSVCDAQQRAA